MVTRNRMSGCFAIALLTLVVAGCGGAGLRPGGTDDASTRTTTSCSTDPDAPSLCTIWTCANVPAEYQKKAHCDARQPPQAPHPRGEYTCPASGGGVYCPGPGSGGEGPWSCVATEFELSCERISGSGSGSPGGICVVLIDEEGIDNDMKSVEGAAAADGVLPAALVNDDRPTEIGNPHLLWNERFAGDIVRLPTGQVDDEGWFALPEQLPWPIEEFVAGTLPQDRLDKIPNVMPLRNQDLVQLVGRTCVAVVYDSDISMNYLPINANLQGARYGLFSFTVLAVEVPGSLAESGSSTSLYDVWLRVEAPLQPGLQYQVQVRDHEPDSIQIERAQYDRAASQLVVTATGNFAPGAYMTVSVDGADEGTDFLLSPSVLEAALSHDGRAYQITIPLSEDVTGRRVTISTDEGGAFNSYVSLSTAR